MGFDVESITRNKVSYMLTKGSIFPKVLVISNLEILTIGLKYVHWTKYNNQIKICTEVDKSTILMGEFNSFFQ